MSENEISRDAERRPGKPDRKTLFLIVGFCLGLVLLIALNMN